PSIQLWAEAKRRTTGTGVMECWRTGVLVFIVKGLISSGLLDWCYERQASKRVHYSIIPTLHYSAVLVSSPRLVSHQRLLVFSEALICLSYSGDHRMD